METRGFFGGFYKLAEWVSRIAITNVLWFILSIPPLFLLILTLYARYTNTPFSEGVTFESFAFQNFFLGIALAPFTLFPATSALFTSARRWVMGEGDRPIFSTYFGGYKDNYKQSMMAGFLFTILLIGGVVGFFNTEDFLPPSFALVKYVYALLFILTIMTMLYFFSLIVHVRLTTVQLIRSAFLFIFANPIRSLLFSFIVIGLYALTFSQQKLLIGLLFFTSSIAAALFYWNFNGMYYAMRARSESLEKGE